MDYKKNGKIHDIIVFSKAFLSFSKDENEAMNFIGIPNKETYGVLYILENYNRNTSASNAYIEELSAFPEEKEILFFPGSSFIIKDINDLNNGIMKITLNYHGKFQEYYDIFSKSKNTDKEIILSNTTSLNEILDSKKYNSLLDESDNDSSYLNSLSSIHQLYEIKTEINNTKKKTKQIVSKNKSDNLKLHSRHNKRLLLSQRKEKEEKNEISSKELKENSKELKDSNPASDSNSIITLSIEKASCDIGDIYDRIVEPKIIEGKKLEFFKNGEYLIINNNIKIHDYSQLIQRVMKARNLKNNEIVLIKEFDGIQDKEYFKELIKLIKKIRDISQHFSGLKNIFQISSKYFMVVDIYEGNIYDYLKRIYPKGVPPNLIKKIIFQLGSTLIGLKDGEGQRAINPKNILIKYTNENKNNFDVFLSENGIYEFENDIFSFYFYHSKVMNYRIIYKNPFCQYGNLNDNNLKIKNELFSIGMTLYVLFKNINFHDIEEENDLFECIFKKNINLKDLKYDLMKYKFIQKINSKYAPGEQYDIYNADNIDKEKELKSGLINIIIEKRNNWLKELKNKCSDNEDKLLIDLIYNLTCEKSSIDNYYKLFNHPFFNQYNY